MHYIELYIFALDLYSNSLNHFIWKRLKVTVCGYYGKVLFLGKTSPHLATSEVPT